MRLAYNQIKYLLHVSPSGASPIQPLLFVSPLYDLRFVVVPLLSRRRKRHKEDYRAKSKQAVRSGVMKKDS